jgi:hypothetical protein
MNHVTFTIGQGLDASNRPIADLSTKRQRALTDIARTFGGYTAHDASGGWIHDGQLIEEPSLSVDVMTDASEPTIRHEAETLAALFNQSAVMVAEDSANVAFVEQTTSKAA